MASEKYTAFKLKGINHWLWFKTENVREITTGLYDCKDGWGKGGESTSVSFDKRLIEGELSSSALQYT